MPAAERPGFLFVVCPDVQILLEAVERQAALHAPGDGPFKRVCFWGDELPSAPFWEALSLRDLFGSMRLVLVRQANLWPAAVWKSLDKALARPLSGSFPVFCLEGEWSGGKPKVPAVVSKTRCFGFADKRGWVQRVPGLGDRTARDYLVRGAKERGIGLDAQALAALCESAPRQAGVLSNELDKLALLAEPGKPVTRALLATAEWSPEAQVFDCVSRLLAGDARGAWREIARTADMDAAAFPLLGLLAWNFRTLWQLLAGDAPQRPGRLTRAQAQGMGARRLSEGMRVVAETELAIKTGTPARQAMEMAASRLLQLFSRGGR